MFNLNGKKVLFVLAVSIIVFALGAVRLTGFLEEDLLSKTPSQGEVILVEERPRIIFVGDIMLARSVERTLLSLPQDHAFLGMRELFKDNFVVGNFEASIPVVHEPTPNFTFKFSVMPEFLPILKEAGVDYLSLANNHALDHGTLGYSNTLKELEKQGLVSFGHPLLVSSSSITYINLEDKRVALIGISNLFTNPEWEPLINEASNESDLQVVYVHWGNEYEGVHSEREERLAIELIDAGVDIIVGHHPHVVQDIWRYNDGLVFYSLGNFIFDQYWEDAVLMGLTLDLSFESEKGWQVGLIPVESKSVRLQPKEMIAGDREAFLLDLAARSDPILTKGITEGVISLQF